MRKGRALKTRALFFSPGAMTSERAIHLLRIYTQNECIKPSHDGRKADIALWKYRWDMYKYGESAYIQVVVREVIVRIRNNPDKAPMDVVHDYICWLDDIRLHSKSRHTHKFTRNMIWICDNLQQYLHKHDQEEEKRL